MCVCLLSNSLNHSFLFLFIPCRHFFWKIFAKILARFNLIAYLCHRYNLYVEHSTWTKGETICSSPTNYFWCCGLIFLPVTFRIEPRNALCSCGAFHIVWSCRLTEYGGSPSTCFLALCGGSHVSCSRRGSASRFFRTPTSTVPDGFGHKATTYILCKQLHLSSAQLSCARWASARLRSRLGSTQRAK